MADFIKGTEVRTPSSRGRLEEKLTPAEVTEFRSSIGCLQWCTSTCRPHVAADTSLLQKGASELQVEDCCEAQRVITYLKSTPDNGFVINAINLGSLSSAPTAMQAGASLRASVPRLATSSSSQIRTPSRAAALRLFLSGNPTAMSNR